MTKAKPGGVGCLVRSFLRTAIFYDGLETVCHNYFRRRAGRVKRRQIGAPDPAALIFPQLYDCQNCC